MTYDAHETSVEGGRPVELFRFTAGAVSYFYTSAEDEVTIAAQAYQPRAISRAETREGTEERKHDFQVVLPTSDDVAQIFVGVLPGIRVRLTVSRFHRDDTPTPQARTIFDGYVQSAQFRRKSKECVLTARPTLGARSRTIPRRKYQGLCNHVTYDPATCKVDPTDPAFRAAGKIVVSQIGNVLTVSGLDPAYPAGWFIGGFVESIGTSDFRMILEQDPGGVLTLLLPFPIAPSTVNVFAGDDHSADTCANKFSNLENFGGFFSVPTSNPFVSGLD